MGLSADDKLLMERIEHNFKFYPPSGEQAEKYVRMRQTAKGLARQIVEMCPEGEERSTALVRLEEAVMWANAAIARGINAAERD
jgi:GH25 family lysozyme M1 (1,4-beta-N-acetylmuramidase)